MCLTPWSGVIIEKLTVTQLVKIFSHLMEVKGSLPYSPGPYPEPDESSAQLPTLLLCVTPVKLSHVSIKLHSL